MSRPLPVWLVLFLALCSVLFTVAAVWSVRSTVMGSDRSGMFGKAMVQVADFPPLVRKVAGEVTDYATGNFQDAEFVVPRDIGPAQPGFVSLPGAEALKISGPMLRATPQAARGWRLLAGTFRIGDRVDHGALLISPDLEAVRFWPLEDRVTGPEDEAAPPHKTFPHGIALLPDGSVIFAFDGADSLQRIDACGAPVWVVGGHYHHAVTRDPAGDSVWTLRRQGIARVDVESGNVLQSLSTDDIAEANPEIDIFGPRRDEERENSPNQRRLETVALSDPTHLNDVDPLPPAMAEAFPMFEAGDLLVSARSLNLVFVVDPDTTKVKWWRIGATRRQHDPDWLPSGEILVYDNRMGQGDSRIVAINPETQAVRTVFDGAGTGFYSRIRGKQQMRRDGTLIVTSPQQGHAFEIGENGDIALEIVNTKPGSDNENYIISELKWYPPGEVNLGKWTCIQND